MRLYSFVNYYLSPLQHGLQTAHCVSDMSGRYTMSDRRGDAYLAWAASHKTIIICNGGNVAMLEDLHTRLTDFADEFNLPLVKFYEDEQSLNNALTSVAIIVPEKFYDTQFQKAEMTGAKSAYEYLDTNGYLTMYWEGTREFDFIQLLKSFRLA